MRGELAHITEYGLQLCTNNRKLDHPGLCALIPHKIQRTLSCCVLIPKQTVKEIHPFPSLNLSNLLSLK